MSVVMHLCVCLCVCKSMERKLSLYKAQCVLDILVICYILCYCMFTGSNLHMSFDFGKDILNSYHNYQNYFFIYFDGFNIWFINLVVCYSLDPVLVIWYVSLIIFA